MAAALLQSLVRRKWTSPALISSKAQRPCWDAKGECLCGLPNPQRSSTKLSRSFKTGPPPTASDHTLRGLTGSGRRCSHRGGRAGGGTGRCGRRLLVARLSHSQREQRRKWERERRETAETDFESLGGKSTAGKPKAKTSSTLSSFPLSLCSCGAACETTAALRPT